MQKQIQKALPRSAWQNVVIAENHEPIVEILETEKIIYGSHLSPWKNENSYFVKKTLAEMIINASLNLPRGYKLAIVEGVRTLTKQQEHWDLKYQAFKLLHEDWTHEEIERQVALVVARPTALANHNCGGAVDVCLIRDDGSLVDMGTLPQDIREMKFVEMFSRLITPEQSANRTILREAMESAGFVWYPGEWWHYCYGDRMWAVYTRRTECFYGPIELAA